MRECYGCIENDACPIQDASEAHNCPCSTCVVKIICNGACLEWDIMFDAFYTEARRAQTINERKIKNEQPKTIG